MLSWWTLGVPSGRSSGGVDKKDDDQADDEERELVGRVPRLLVDRVLWVILGLLFPVPPILPSPPES